MPVLHYHLCCRTEDGCHWSARVDLPSDDDLTSQLLVVLRAHADNALHGPRIEGIATGINRAGDIDVIALRHP